jgi:hypothetical protein
MKRVTSMTFGQLPGVVLGITFVTAVIAGAWGSLGAGPSAASTGQFGLATTTHTSDVFGFAVDIPQNWRRSDVLSTVIPNDPIFLGHEVFTARTVADEEAKLKGHEWMGPAWGWTVIVMAHNNPQQLTTAQWATSIYAGARAGQVIDTIALGGQTATRITGGARFSVQYFISYKGLMYLIAYNTHRETIPTVDENTLKTIVASFRFTR